MPPAINRFNIAGSILAGGAGSRMGGVDKGLLEIAGKPLIVWAIEHLAPQAAQIMVSANRNHEQYLQHAGEVVADEHHLNPGQSQGEVQEHEYAGPLAGFLACMRVTSAPYLLTLPCDAPFAPPDLGQRLAQALTRNNADVAIAQVGDTLHPVHALVATSLQNDLAQALARGERSVARWCTAQACVQVSFDDQSDAFININTPELLAMQTKRIIAEHH